MADEIATRFHCVLKMNVTKAPDAFFAAIVANYQITLAESSMVKIIEALSGQDFSRKGA